jgi:hypothetical protein
MKMTGRVFAAAAGIAAVTIMAMPASAMAGPRTNRSLGTEVSGTMGGSVCRAGYQTKVGDFVPLDDTTADNAAAATVTLKKSCAGAVVAQFTSEIWVVASGSLHVDFYATCTSTGGFAHPCTVGQKVKASPGDFILSDDPVDSLATHTATMIFKGLKRGVWRIDAVPGGDGASGLDYRTLFVQAFNGG